ncbi:MAG: hypothetical protein WCP21_04350, partial [Armatimonadota bacterium]
GTGVGGRLADTVEVTDNTVAQVTEALRPFGVRNPLAAYLNVEVGQYHTGEFEAKQSLQKVIDVTPRVSGPGAYNVKFTHTVGYNGATVQRVALASAPKEHPEQLTEIVFDKHYGVIGYTPTAPEYALPLAAYDPERLYFILIEMSAPKDSTQPENRRGCNGSITLWKIKPPGEEIKTLPLLPMSDTEKARYGGPKFTRGGVRVGVVQGGYGSESILRFLQGAAGVDAQPLWLVNPEYLKQCQALVMPQPKAPETYTPQLADLLSKYVREGGGLVTTHNAVGYRGLPVAVSEVCAKGLVHFRDNVVKLPVEHPIGKGLPLGQGLKGSYYDYITLQPGPAGVVVARGAATGAPVIVCGQAGQGRYVACGLGLAFSAADDSDCPPLPEEGTLLTNMVLWAGGK